jgi:hypothetical protein
MATVKEDNIILGSGDLYLGQVTQANPTEQQITDSLVKVGLITGGASLNYTPTFHDVMAANRKGVIASFLTQEQVTFTSGVLTWDLKNLSRLSAASFTDDELNGKRRVGIGGLSNVPVNYLRFVHTKPDGKKLTVNIFKAQAQNGFEFAFNSEQETVLDIEFKALTALDKTDGNLVEIIEEVGAVVAPKVTSISPTTFAVGAQPQVIVVTGTGFTPDSVVIKDLYTGVEPQYKTFYDSPTQLTAIVEGLPTGAQSIGVRTGTVDSGMNTRTVTVTA